jgi:hypothetical protein
MRQLKRLMRLAQHKKRSKAKTEAQKEKREAAIVEAHQIYITVAGEYLKKAVNRGSSPEPHKRAFGRLRAGTPKISENKNTPEKVKEIEKEMEL